MSVVIDASVVVDLVRSGPAARRIVDRIAGHALVAPHLIDQEVMHAIRRRTLAGQITADAARSALDRFARLSIHRLATGPVLTRAWELRNQATAYDAAYLALAEALGVPLVTLDARLARTHGSAAVVEVIE